MPRSGTCSTPTIVSASRPISRPLARTMIEHVVLRMDMHREPQLVFGGDIAGLAQIFDGVLDRALHLSRRTHQHVAAERDRVLARLAEHLEQPLALVAGGEQPAIFDAEYADRNASLGGQVERLRVAHAGIEATLEIGAAQFDRVEAALFCRIERGGERRGVDGPHMQSEAPELLTHDRSISFVL